MDCGFDTLQLVLCFRILFFTILVFVLRSLLNLGSMYNLTDSTDDHDAPCKLKICLSFHR